MLTGTGAESGKKQEDGAHPLGFFKTYPKFHLMKASLGKSEPLEKRGFPCFEMGCFERQQSEGKAGEHGRNATYLFLRRYPNSARCLTRLPTIPHCPSPCGGITDCYRTPSRTVIL